MEILCKIANLIHTPAVVRTDACAYRNCQCRFTCFQFNYGYINLVLCH